MTFDEILTQVVELLQRQGRVSYGALKRRFALDDDYLQDLKDELIDAQRVAVDEDDKVLVWAGASPVSGSAFQVRSSQSPTLSTQLLTPSPKTLDSRLRDSRLNAAERRQLTVMFCDLVGSTALSQRLDPEDLHQLVRAYQQTCAEVITRYEGHIAQYLGDGILVYFGYPAAHEDDARRAVLAGLEIIAAIQKMVPSSPVEQASSLLAARMAAPPEGRGEGTKVSAAPAFTPHPNLPPQGGKEPRTLQVRIGIHTGLVVVGEIGSSEKRELLALGETPNIAARVQGQAEPNTLVISGDTYHLVQGFFACNDLGPQELKGLSAPLRLYHVQGAGAAQSRFEVSVQQGLTPLVGREEESELLARRWQRAKAGEGQVVLLSGEAGIGKSRLVQVLRAQIAAEPQVSIICHCSPFYQNSALYAVIDGWQRVLQLDREDAPEEKLGKLAQALTPMRLNDPETLALFAALLSIPLPDAHPPLQLTPQKQKEKTLHSLMTWLQRTAERQPVRLEIEDLHWADPSTLEWLGLLIDRVPSFRLLVLLTFRPEFTPPWPTQAYMLPLQLSRLPQKQIAEMVQRVAGKGLPREVLQQLITKSDGVPLYIEEMTKNVLESGWLKETEGHFEVSGPLPQLAIPATLQDAFASRLDRLAPVRELAQIGAVLGREFSYELLRAVSQLEDAVLQDGLRQLGAAEIVYQRGVPPDATYTFKHALLQDAAYASLLKSQRHQLHVQAAHVLEQQFGEVVETHPELLAHHYTEAELKEQAIPYWQKAGQRAAQRSANIEAISHLTKGLDLLKTLPDTPGRAQRELTLQLALGGPLQTLKGYAAPEVERVYTRALELCRQVGETPRLFWVLLDLSSVRCVRAEHQTARELAEQCLRLAQRMHSPPHLVWAHYALGMILFPLGEFAAAQDHLEQGLTLYDPQKSNPLVTSDVQDPKATCLSSVAWVLWHLGYPDQALQRIQEALALARDLGHSFSLAFTLEFAASLHQFRRERKTAQEQAEAVLALANEQRFPLWLAGGIILRGWALAEQGQGTEGIAQMYQGMATWRATGAEMWRPYWLALLAEVYGTVGQAEEGLSTLAEALVAVEKTGERFYEAELYRLRGELTLAQSRVQSLASSVPNTQHPTPSTQAEAEAEACFLKAIDIARKQQAKSLELRAATSLARLWHQQGKQAEARQMLEEIYGWFTEGFATKDLQEAKALLKELSEGW